MRLPSAAAGAVWNEGVERPKRGRSLRDRQRTLFVESRHSQKLVLKRRIWSMVDRDGRDV